MKTKEIDCFKLAEFFDWFNNDNYRELHFPKSITGKNVLEYLSKYKFCNVHYSLYFENYDGVSGVCAAYDPTKPVLTFYKYGKYILLNKGASEFDAVYPLEIKNDLMDIKKQHSHIKAYDDICAGKILRYGYIALFETKYNSDVWSLMHYLKTHMDVKSVPFFITVEDGDPFIPQLIDEEFIQVGDIPNEECPLLFDKIFAYTENQAVKNILVRQYNTSNKETI